MCLTRIYGLVFFRIIFPYSKHFDNYFRKKQPLRKFTFYQWIMFLIMKNTLLLLIFLSITFVGFAQESKKLPIVEGKTVKTQQIEKKHSNHDENQKLENKSDEPVIILKLSSSGNSQVTDTQQELTPDQIQKIDERILAKQSLINSIDKKVLDVKNNPEANKKAEENGWFLQMENNRKAAAEEIEKLNALKNK